MKNKSHRPDTIGTMAKINYFEFRLITIEKQGNFSFASAEDQMSQLISFRLQILFIHARRFRLNGYAFRYFNTETFQPNNFLWIIGQQPDLFHTKVEKDLRCKTVVPDISMKTERFVRFNGIFPFVLKFISLQLVHKADPAPFLPHVH